MKFTREQRLEIGKEIYTRNISVNEAAIKYEINNYTARDYMRMYRDENNLPPISDSKPKAKRKETGNFIKYDDLANLSKEELIDEVIKARVDAERSKKGYTVKGVGQEKEFINLKNPNSK